MAERGQPAPGTIRNTCTAHRQQHLALRWMISDHRPPWLSSETQGCLPLQEAVGGLCDLTSLILTVSFSQCPSPHAKDYAQQGRAGPAMLEMHTKPRSCNISNYVISISRTQVFLPNLLLWDLPPDSGRCGLTLPSPLALQHNLSVILILGLFAGCILPGAQPPRIPPGAETPPDCLLFSLSHLQGYRAQEQQHDSKQSTAPEGTAPYFCSAGTDVLHFVREAPGEQEGSRELASMCFFFLAWLK